MTHTKYCMDANAFITPWDVYYPIGIFPSLWEKLSQKKEHLFIIDPIFKEIKDNSLTAWLTEHAFSERVIDNNTLDTEGVLREGLKLEEEYSVEKKTRSSGVDENDLQLIAFAKKRQLPVVTYESPQHQAPDKKSKYKIPRVCKEQGVDCISFVTLLEKIDIHI